MSHKQIWIDTAQTPLAFIWRIFVRQNTRSGPALNNSLNPGYLRYVTISWYRKIGLGETLERGELQSLFRERCLCYCPPRKNFMSIPFYLKNNLQGDCGHFRENNQMILSKVAKISLKIVFKSKRVLHEISPSPARRKRPRSNFKVFSCDIWDFESPNNVS